MTTDVQTIVDAISAPLKAEGLLVEDVKVHGSGSSRTVTVVIDLDTDTSEPVSMETIAGATRQVSELVDNVDLFHDQPYMLEVTSPGASRNLTTPRHFLRNMGRTLDVRTNGPSYTGKLVDVSETGITLESDKGQNLVVSFSDITKAKVVLKFR